MEEDIVVIQLSIQLEKVYLMREGRDKKKKAAKGQAAFLLLKDLEVCLCLCTFLQLFSFYIFCSFLLAT